METKPRFTILFVDDDDVVRRLVRRILEADFDLLEANSLEAAIAIADADPRSIDLLLTDVVMPGGRGETLAQNLSATRKNLRVLYMTGYGADGVRSGGPCLPKPFTPRSLREGVDRALDAQEA